MRPCTEAETRTIFEKLASYTGRSLKNLIAPLSDAPNADRYVFRVQKDRVYYVLLSIANIATSIARDRLVSLGVCLGKFTKTGKFRLHITALPVLADHARYKIWIKPNGEQPFLYGGHVVKAHVGRCSDDIPSNSGVILYNMNDVPIGFGVTSRSTAEMRNIDPTSVVCFRQADCGEYLRDEDNLFSTG